MDNKLLVIGIGNSSRGDDGLGWAFLDQLAQTAIASHLQLEYRYQLVVEDAELMSHFSKVIFVDACQKTLSDGFSFEPCGADEAAGLYTHQQTPGAILYVSSLLYQHVPKAYCLLIEGRQWALGSGLSAAGKRNLREAAACFSTRLNQTKTEVE